MTDSPSPRTRHSALAPATRSLRLQRIFPRTQDGDAYADVAAEGAFRESGCGRSSARRRLQVAATTGRTTSGCRSPA